MPVKSPFDASTTIAKPGQGRVILSLLPPSLPSLSTLTYQYPLKLVTRSPEFIPESSVLQDATRPVHLHLLSYGGGLLPGDVLDVSIRLEPRTRLVLTTPQGTTKIYKTSADGNAADTSKQSLNVQVENEAALCYLPDPSVPFRDSRYEQVQTFTISMDDADKGSASSICVLDWVTQGRGSLGEDWDFNLWRGKNEVWTVMDDKKKAKKLLLRDSVVLKRDNPYGIRDLVFPHGVVGTLILYGPVFEHLSFFIMDTFTGQPRIGARNWSSSSTTTPAESTVDEVIWTAARVRAGFVLVKFGAKGFEAGKAWLGDLLRKEGSVAREFGEEALWSL